MGGGEVLGDGRWTIEGGLPVVGAHRARHGDTGARGHGWWVVGNGSAMSHDTDLLADANEDEDADADTDEGADADEDEGADADEEVRKRGRGEGGEPKRVEGGV